MLRLSLCTKKLERAQVRMRNMNALEPALTSVGILNHLVV